ncbi:hypothetical protein G6F45_012156 [Rhizopus arrhizus]|nr:hypothetical protein G6F51_012335 [Rhizopus arrhizus]KAG1561704.1 hypothetical protein G6F50_012172 [Rhizopus delemar]KAG1617223.1 hypothetical protein G6F45_012156 [Rhizopus arrhizus]
MIPDLPGKFNNEVTDVSQLNLEADESDMIVCYTTSITNNEETAEGNIDETEENDKTEQDEQCVDIVECKKRLREAYETILMYEVPLDDLDRKLHRRIRMTLAGSCAELNKSKEQTDLRSYFTKKTSYLADTWIELKKSVTALIHARLRYQTEGLEAMSDVATMSRVSLSLQSSWSTTELKSGGRTHVSDGDESNEEKLSEKESSSESSYNPSSKSSSTEIVTSRKPIYSYLTGAGIEEYTRPTKPSQWMIGEVDLTEKFLEYRALIVDNARKMKTLSQVDQLALNFICLISNNSKSGNLMDGDVWDIMVEQCRDEFPLQPLNRSHSAWCHNVNEIARTNVKEAKRIVQDAKISDDLAVAYRDVYHDILRAYSSNYSVDGVNEDTYVHDALQPLLKAYFPNDDVICREGANGTIKASSSRKQKFDPNSHGRKGDCSVKTNDGCLSQLVLLVEVKPPRNATSNDLVKLGKCLKDVVDKLDEDGVRDGLVCGLLAEGYRCRAFAMDLKFHGLYRMIHLGTFYVPQDSNNLDVLCGAFQVMNLLMAIVIRNAKYIKKQIRKRAPPSTMALPSFESPIRINEEQKRFLLNISNPRVKCAARKLNFE